VTKVPDTVLSGPGGEVAIGDDHPFRIIGERINPTGRSKLSEELQAMEMATVRRDAIAQVEAGAAVLDLNAGIPGFDEAAMLSAMVEAVQDEVGVPLCIDSSTPEALEAAVPLARGKVLINSVTAEARSLERLLPLVRRFGAAVIGMANDEDGISMEPQVRLAEEMSSIAPMDDAVVFFTSGGAESVETAAKLARRYWSLVGEPDRTVVISRERAYSASRSIVSRSAAGSRNSVVMS